MNPADYSEIKKQFDNAALRLHRMSVGIPPIEGVTRSESAVLITIDLMVEEGCEIVRPGEIARRLFTTPSALSQMLKALEAKGMVSRDRDSEDSRAISVSLTEKGRNVVEIVQSAEDERLIRLVDYIGEEDAGHFVRTFVRIADYFEGSQVR